MRLGLFKGIILLLFFILFCRLFYIQVIKAYNFKRLAERIYQKTEIIQAKRGNIYDRKGRLLATTIQAESLYANPYLLKNKLQVARKLAKILKINYNQILSKLNKKAYFVWIKRKLNPELVERIKKERIKGLGFIAEYKRVYPKANLASTVLGFVSIDNEGLEGLEFVYNKYLKGKPAKIRLLKDANNNLIWLREKTDLQEGYSIVLTIDEFIQQLAEEELRNACLRHYAKNGSIIILYPNTGEILALATYPDFNPNEFYRYKPESFHSKAVVDLFEPGSTFKIIPIAYLLENKIININNSNNFFCNCKGFIKVGNRIIRCYKSHGNLDFTQVIKYSCNVGMIKAAKNIHSEEFYKFIKKCGFLQKTNIDLPYEAEGILQPPKNWSYLTLPNLVIGQGIAVTHLQLALASNIIATRGNLMKPFIVKAIIDDRTGKVIFENSPIIKKRVISKETAEIINSMLTQVVEGGTGIKARTCNFKIAGKTGTAQKQDPITKKYSKTLHVSSFVGYLPADDPKLLISVVINEPKGVYWGSEVAVPVFKNICDALINYLRLKPETLPKEKNLILTKVDSSLATKLVSASNKSEALIIPDLTGLSMREVKRILRLYNINSFILSGSGIVIKQYPKPFTEIKQDQEVFVWFSQEFY